MTDLDALAIQACWKALVAPKGKRQSTQRAAFIARTVSLAPPEKRRATLNILEG